MLNQLYCLKIIPHDGETRALELKVIKFSLEFGEHDECGILEFKNGVFKSLDISWGERSFLDGVEVWYSCSGHPFMWKYQNHKVFRIIFQDHKYDWNSCLWIHPNSKNFESNVKQNPQHAQ